MKFGSNDMGCTDGARGSDTKESAKSSQVDGRGMLGPPVYTTGRARSEDRAVVATEALRTLMVELMV